MKTVVLEPGRQDSCESWERKAGLSRAPRAEGPSGGRGRWPQRGPRTRVQCCYKEARRGVGVGRAASGLWDLRGDQGEEAFDLRWEVWVWPPREAGAGDTDLDSGHIEVTAGRARMTGLSE